MRKCLVAIAGLAAMFAMPVLAQEAVETQPDTIIAASALPAQGAPDFVLPAATLTDAATAPRPPVIPTSAFAGQGNFRSATLSPNGAMIALEMDINGQPNIVLFDADTRKPIKRFSLGQKVGLEWFRWAGNSKILLSVSKSGDFFGEESLFTRLFVADINGADFEFVGNKEPVLTGDDVIHVAPDGSHVLLTLQATPYDYPSVYRFDLNDPGKGTKIESPRTDIWNYSADSAGVVRIGSGWSYGRLRVYYRRTAGEKMEMVGKFKEEDTESELWDVAYIKPGSDIGYVLDRNENGRLELQSFDFARREKVETIYANPDWDLDVAYIARDGTPEAAIFTDDRERVVWFKEADQRRQASLERVLKEDEVWISSRAQDGSRILVMAGGEADPGAAYIYTPAENRLDLFSELRPQIAFADLAKPVPIKYKSRDGIVIPGYLTLPRGRKAGNFPLILLPHGGPYGVRDKLQYNDEVQLLVNRGYAVLQPNYRGSGGYGRKFSALGTGQIGRRMQDDLDDAMDWAVAQGIADPDRVCVVGGSYGGYASLWAAVRNPERYRCAASWAGVTDLDSQVKYDRNSLTRKGGKSWRKRVEGGEEDFDLDMVSPYRQAAKLTRPILLAHGTDDSTVPFSQFKKMRDATKNAVIPAELLVIEKEGHSFSKPENEQKWYDTLVAFLAKHNPAD